MEAVHMRPGPTAYARLTRRPGRSYGRGAAATVAEAYGPAGVTGDAWAEGLWSDHGSAVYALALALLGDEGTALRAVALGMVDFARWDIGTPTSDVRRVLSRHVHRRCADLASETSVPAGLPPLMGRIARLARLQRAAVALCVFGGHTYRDASEVLGLAPVVVAQLLTSSMGDLGASAPLVAD